MINCPSTSPSIDNVRCQSNPAWAVQLGPLGDLHSGVADRDIGQSSPAEPDTIHRQSGSTDLCLELWPFKPFSFWSLTSLPRQVLVSGTARSYPSLRAGAQFGPVSFVDFSVIRGKQPPCTLEWSKIILVGLMVLLGFCQWLSHLLIGMVKYFSVARVASAQFRGPTKQRASVLILVLIALLYGLESLSFTRADMNWNGRTPGCQHPAVVSLSTGLQRTWQQCVNYDQGLHDLWVKFHQRLKHMPTLRLSACGMHQDLHFDSLPHPCIVSIVAVAIFHLASIYSRFPDRWHKHNQHRDDFASRIDGR